MPEPEGAGAVAAGDGEPAPSHGGVGPHAPPTGRRLAGLSLAALGIVFGDIGTSPLYALRECFYGEHPLAVTPASVLGVLSLIFWSLVIVISVKYLAYVMRADNEGEGGILALMALAERTRADGDHRRLWWVITMLGLFGAALLYGDGVITPAISVLSAVEGLEIVSPALVDWVIPVTIVILVALFWFQHRGTAVIGKIFGPVTFVWFLCIAGFGLAHIAGEPRVIEALNPVWAVGFFGEHGVTGLFVLGAVFLVVTGGEALYADMGHFGSRPIRLMWFTIVLPALLLNYFGQGALLLAHPTVKSPFFEMLPRWSLVPMVILATFATIIASQAIISGTYSLSRQAMMLGYLPRLRMIHTSSEEIGQIYLPGINWALMFGTLILVVGFGSSSGLAAAYGVAVTTTMVITSLLAAVIALRMWRWNVWFVVGVTALLLSIDTAFFGANIIKVAQGGWVPLVIASLIFITMTTWRRGRAILKSRIDERTMSWGDFVAWLEREAPTQCEGTAIFLQGRADGVPPSLVYNVKANRVLHQHVILLTVVAETVPRVPLARRLEIDRIDDRFTRIIGRYGYTETRAVMELLENAERAGVPVQLDFATFFLSRETVLATERPGMAIWRERLFAYMSRNALPATTFFGIPPERVIEVGAQIEL